MAGTGLCIALMSCGGGNVSPQAIAISSEHIVTWGDSTTSGIGASTFDLSYPAQLQAITGRNTYNGGVSGQTSSQIAARQGGAPALMTLPDNILPAVGLVTIQSQSTFPITPEGQGPITGTLGGVHGTLSYQISANNPPQLQFKRDIPGMLISIPAQSPFLPDTQGRETQINVFWMGENNFYDPFGVKSDIAKCIAFLANQKFIVMSLLNSGNEGIGTSSYAQLELINADLARSYPNNFLDIRKVLVNSYDSSKPQDVIDHNNDVPPYSLRNDNEHLNDKGYAIVAKQLADYIANKSW
jgi:lysophospholipase L1-like esterase